MLDDKSPCPSCGFHPLAVLRHPDGSLEMECKHCGTSMTRKPPLDSNKEIVIRIEKMEIGLRACVADQLDFAKAVAQLERRVEKMEGGKVE